MRPRTRIWIKSALAAILALTVTGICLVVYCFYLSSDIQKRFSGRRWSLPSKVYSDTTLMYPGQNLNRDLLETKLDHLGYRRVSYAPKKKGEMRLSLSTLEIYLNDFMAPHGNRKAFPVKIGLVKNAIDSMVNLETGDPVSLLELEPEELMLFFGPDREQRKLISISQVPRHVSQAILAAEDAHFYEHHGVDPWGILRALYQNLRHGDIRQGGSTITQQLAKNYFLTPERSISRKFKEVLMALTMEGIYEKDVILEIYLNEIYLGQNGSVSVNGIGEASLFYFNKQVSELSLNEGATIAAIIRAPGAYSPYADKERCQQRRDWVLRRMLKQGWISEEQLLMVQAQPVETSGFENYAKRAPYFLDYLAQQLKVLYSEEVLTSFGLSIFTTLDTQVQMAAEKALQRGLARIEKTNPTLKRTEPEKKLQGAVIVMQPKTGYLLAMAGGRNYNESQFNRATQAKRQPGSAFKPFVFLSGLGKFTAASWLSNEPKTYTIDGKPWQPHNYVPMSETRVTMRSALAKSVNLATVDLAMQIGINRVIDTASAFQFTTPLKPYPSLALGSSEVIPLELARAYCAFAADGVLPNPLSLKEVLDEKGQMLERRHSKIESVTTPAKAFLITSMLRSSIEEGTTRPLKGMGISFPVASKTGTTSNLKDAWLVGYTPDILALVWVGFDNGDPIHASGSSAALPIWADLMNAIPHHVSGEWFITPPGVETRVICSESGKLASERCPNPREEVFLTETPKEGCPIHGGWDPLKKVLQGVKDLFKGL